MAVTAPAMSVTSLHRGRLARPSSSRRVLSRVLIVRRAPFNRCSRGASFQRGPSSSLYHSERPAWGMRDPCAGGHGFEKPIRPPFTQVPHGRTVEAKPPGVRGLFLGSQCSTQPAPSFIVLRFSATISVVAFRRVADRGHAGSWCPAVEEVDDDPLGWQRRPADRDVAEHVPGTGARAARSANANARRGSWPNGERRRR